VPVDSTPSFPFRRSRHLPRGPSPSTPGSSVCRGPRATIRPGRRRGCISAARGARNPRCLHRVRAARAAGLNQLRSSPSRALSPPGDTLPTSRFGRCGRGAQTQPATHERAPPRARNRAGTGARERT
jgi:hypothetical protein